MLGFRASLGSAARTPKSVSPWVMERLLPTPNVTGQKSAHRALARLLAWCPGVRSSLPAVARGRKVEARSMNFPVSELSRTARTWSLRGRALHARTWERAPGRQRSPPDSSSSSPEQEGSSSRCASPSGRGPRSSTRRAPGAHPSQPRYPVGCNLRLPPPGPGSFPAGPVRAAPPQPGPPSRRIGFRVYGEKRDREGAARNCAAACGFSRVTCGESVFPHPSELCKSRRCTSSAPLPPASTPRLACKQKGKGEGPGESRSPLRQARRAPPAALREGAFISRVQP